LSWSLTNTATYTSFFNIVFPPFLFSTVSCRPNHERDARKGTLRRRALATRRSLLHERLE
jgi:hypothetical protein